MEAVDNKTNPIADNTKSLPTHARTATLNRTTSGKPLGIAIFLTADDLKRMGLDLLTSSEIDYLPTEHGLQLAER